jgi:hypothetical protein
MADQLTATGLEIDSLEDRIEAVNALLRSAISANLDLSADQPTGQLVRILCERAQAVLELIRSVNAGMDPDAATGDALTALCLLTGTQRRAASAGTVTLTLVLDALTTVPAGSVAHVAGDAENRWVTNEDVTSVGAGNYFVAATCEATGPIQALAGTITVIATPVAGWNTVTNALDAAEGEAEETDTALRLRREVELTIGGSTTTDAIRAELLALTGMIEAIVYENDRDLTVDGIPPHAFEAILWDGAPPTVANADITEAIWTSKAAGIRPWGSTLSTHTDEQGIMHAVRFTRADPLRILVEVTLLVDPATFPGAAAMQVQIETSATAYLTVNAELYRSKVIDWAMELPGVLNVSLVRLAIWPAAFAAADVTVGLREIATVDAADVTVL